MVTGIYAAWTYVEQLERSLNFYVDVLGLRVRYREDTWVELAIQAESDTTVFALLQRPVAKGPVTPRKLRIMLSVDDIEASLRSLDDAGVMTMGGIRRELYGALLTVVDPDGHWLELFEARVC